MLQLSKASWHYKLHRLLYGRWAREPKNLCPYFWKTIFVGVLFIVPLTIFCLPAKLVNMFIPKDWRENINDDEGYMSGFLLYAVGINLFLAILISMVGVWFIPWPKEPAGIHYFAIIGYFILVILIIVGIVTKVQEYKRSRANLRISKEHAPNVVWESFKAWYKRNCPMIEWEELQTKPND